jgi:hypothetical protein
MKTDLKREGYMSKYKLALAVLCLALFGYGKAGAQYQWTYLNGPEWVKGVDVAYGHVFGDFSWQRYLIGSNGNETRPFFWDHTLGIWKKGSDLNPDPAPIAGANRIISYNHDETDGNDAFLSAYDDNIYATTDGGGTWRGLDFPQNFNNHFSALEIEEHPLHPGDMVFVGCEAYQGLGTAYIRDVVDEQWQWDLLGGVDGNGNPNFHYTLYDIESDHFASGNLNAGTSDGIWTHGIYSDPADPWQYKAFQGDPVEAIEYMPDGHLIASRHDHAHGLYKLEFSTSDEWSDPQEILPNGQSLNKEVRDLSVIHWDGGTKASCYAATPEGLYLIFFDYNDPAEADAAIDIKTLPATDGYYPMLYDKNIEAVDYHADRTENNTYKATILAATPYNVYEIIEERDFNSQLVNDIEISDCVNGTYKSNVVSAAFPFNVSGTQQVFTVSDNGLIKELPASKIWNFIGKAFPDGANGYIGSDITTDFSQDDDYILASSNQGTGGIIVRSEDGGKTWTMQNPLGSPIINSLYLEPPLTSNDFAYAAGGSPGPWFSEDEGETWEQVGDLSGVSDVYPDPSANRDQYVYACGVQSATAWASEYDGSDWTSITDGLESLVHLNELAKGGDIPSLYLATSNGVYKANLNASPVTWSGRTLGIGNPDLGSIVSDKNDPYAFLAAAASSESPEVWASGDSGRSWNLLPLGDIQGDFHINKLASSEDENSGFIASTERGTFYLGPIFRSGLLSTNETWGPGTVIINGDVTVPAGVILTIAPGTDVKFVYDFDKLASGSSTTKSELIVNGTLNAGDADHPDEPVVFESSYPGSPSAGQWYGIRALSGSTINLEYCQIKDAYYGIITDGAVYLTMEHTLIDNCASIGVYLPNSAGSTNDIYYCSIQNCGNYGIYCSGGTFDAESDTISKVTYGIYYYGSGSPSISSCQITNSLSSTQYGIYVQSSPSSASPIIDNSYISGFIQGGIYLQDVSSSCYIARTQVASSGVYGIKLNHSFPQIIMMGSTGNLVQSSTYGLYATSSSSPYIRSTKFEDNTSRGVLIDNGSSANLGTTSDEGNNSFIRKNPTYVYYHVYNNNAFYTNAYYDYWSPRDAQYLHHVNYIPFLSDDPLPKIALADEAPLAQDLALSTSYPNPFNPTVTISFNLSSPQIVSVKVYNIMGQEVRDLYSGPRGQGTVSQVWVENS